MIWHKNAKPWTKAEKDRAHRMAEEIWKAIPGFIGAYEISSLGVVRSLTRKAAAGNMLRERILKPKPHTGGYLRVALCRPGEKPKDFFIHRLVLLAFIGPCPPGHEACHNDGNRRHNSLSNLRWGTRIENSADRRLHGTQPLGVNHYMVRRPELVRRGSRVIGAVLDEKSVAQIRRLLSKGETQTAIAEQFNVSRRCIGMISTGHTWRHVP